VSPDGLGSETGPASDRELDEEDRGLGAVGFPAGLTA
jgi:hypothetical protein